MVWKFINSCKGYESMKIANAIKYVKELNEIRTMYTRVKSLKGNR
jgi:hypothetical protein